MWEKRTLRNVMIFLLLLGNLSCDQISKVVVRESIAYQQIIPVNKFITLTKVENPGAFLSLGHGLSEPLRILLLSLFPLITLVFGLWYLFRKQNLNKGMLIGLSFMIGGGIGNLYDRIAYGSVTDFLHIDFGMFETGIFNLADVSIMIGVMIIIITSFREHSIKMEQSNSGAEPGD